MRRHIALNASLIALLGSAAYFCATHELGWLMAAALMSVVAIAVDQLTRESVVLLFLRVWCWLAAGFVVLVALMVTLAQIVPIEYIVGLTVILAIVVTVIRCRRRDRERALLALSGHCEHCGYDLRASQQRCPECGSDLPEELARRRRIALELRTARQSREAAVRQ